MASVTELLLETLADLSDRDLERFKEVLLIHHWSHFYWCLSEYKWMLLETADMQDTVFLMVLACGQQTVEKTKEVLEMMGRTDLVQRLSDSSSGPKSKTIKTKTYKKQLKVIKLVLNMSHKFIKSVFD